MPIGPQEPERSRLRSAVGPSGFFTLAVGAMVGSGWVVVLGDWLAAAGPGGAIVGFAAGTATMICIALCYGELAGRAAQAGGEFLFVRRTLGRGAAFFVGWFLMLFAAAVCAFESVVLGTLIHALAPSLGGPALYVVGRTTIDTLSLGVGVTGALAIGVLHDRGAISAIRFQNGVTFGFIALMVVLAGLGLAFGSASNLTPAFWSTDGRPWIHGSVWVFSMCAFFLNGWQSSLHALEERRADVDVRRAVRAVIGGILAAGILYCTIILAASGATPWRSVTTQAMPARAAFDALLPGVPLGIVVLVAATLAAAKTWSAVAWVGSRLAVALARDRLLPQALAHTEPKTGAPRRAIILITVLSLAGPIFGRSALLPILDMASICLALSILVCLGVLMLQRRNEPLASNYTVPGGTATVWVAITLASLMIGTALISPLLAHPGQVPPEWLLIGAWGVAGAVFYAVAATRKV